MNAQCKKRYDRSPPPPEIREKLEMSAKESVGLTLRDIKCPDCGFTIEKVFSDIRGHFLAKCPKCKTQRVLNLAYFRRQKGIGKLKLIYYAKEDGDKTE